MDYLIIKWLHILSSTLVLGTGLGIAFFMVMAHRRKNLQSIITTNESVVLADFIFTTPAVVFQFISGVWLLKNGGYNLSDHWVILSIGLYVFAGLCWLPVVWFQLQMRNIAKQTGELETNLTQYYWSLYRRWLVLGILAFPSVVIIFYLMVVKPIW